MNLYVLIDLAHDFNRHPNLNITSGTTFFIGGNPTISSGTYNINLGSVTSATEECTIIGSHGNSTIGNQCEGGEKEPWIPRHDKNKNSLILGGKDIHVARFDTQYVLSATTRRFSNLSHYAASGILEDSWTPNCHLNGRMFLRADNGIYLEVNGQPNKFIDVTSEIIDLKKQVKYLSNIVEKLNEKLGWI